MSKIHVNPKLISTQKDLQRMADKLLKEPILSVDTESNSLFAYREQVCLIQFSIPEEDYLVDPLALDSLHVLDEVFASPKIEKIFHAAEYDLLTLRRDFEFDFANLFDTMIAARILGRKRVGLGSLLEEEFNIHLEKKYQRANWGKRPLPPAMLKYACLDTHFLIRLRNILAEEVKRANRWPIAEEDFTRLAQVNGTPPEPHGVDVWRVSGVYDLEPEQVAILHQLAAYREEKAQQLDRPLFKVIGDRTLVAIAESAPQTLEELGEIKGMTRGQLRRHGKRLLQAVWEGQQAEPIQRPRNNHLDDQIVVLLENMRNWRKLTARKIGVESDIVLPRDVMEKIAHAQPDNKKDLAKLMADVPWRYNRYGEDIFQMIREA
ncbi:MAG: HRDC domain-containing protein [Anaerolineales bacterium]|jgi:ribonuclease D